MPTLPRAVEREYMRARGNVTKDYGRDGPHCPNVNRPASRTCRTTASPRSPWLRSADNAANMFCELGKGTMALVSDSAKPDTGAAAAGVLGFLRKLNPLAGGIGFLLVWQIFVVAWSMPAYLLPSPVAIGRAFVNQLPLLLSNGWVTVYEMLAGYALAVGVAIPLAIAITSSRRFNQLVMPTMLF